MFTGTWARGHNNLGIPGGTGPLDALLREVRAHHLKHKPEKRIQGTPPPSAEKVAARSSKDGARKVRANHGGWGRHLSKKNHSKERSIEDMPLRVAADDPRG